MEKIKVLLVSKFYHPVKGGVENHIKLLTESIKEKFPITVLCCNTKRKTEVEEKDGLKIVKVGSIGTLRSMPLSPTFPSWVRKIKADILHFHLPFPLGVISYFLAKPEGKIIITWHSDIVRQKIGRLFYHPFLIRFLKKADVIIATSPNMIESSSYLKRFKEKCKVIPLGIDVERFKLKEDEEERVKKIREKYISGKGIILFVGRLIYYKGVEYLIRAMRDVDATCLIIGEGKLKKKLEKMVDELGLSSKMHFLGSVSDEELPLYYHACDVFCLPSVAKSEAFGIVQLEAMACGKPCVSTDLPTGVPFVNQNGKTGIIVPPKNPDALAKAINTLLDDPALREKYGSYAKERVKRKFKREVMVKRIIEVYQEVLKKQDRCT